MAKPRHDQPASIADRIRWSLNHLDMTQAALATRAGMAPSQLSALLKRLDRRPWGVELETVGRLATALTVSPMWLLHGIGEPFRTFEPGDSSGYPRLADYQHWPAIVASLRQAGYLRDDRITNWVGDCRLPLSSPDELTPAAVLAQARVWVEIGVGAPLVAPVSLPTTVESDVKKNAKSARRRS